MKVIATNLGYRDHIRIKEGTTFDVKDSEIASWFEPVDEAERKAYHKRRDAKLPSATAGASGAGVSELKQRAEKAEVELGEANDKIAELNGAVDDANAKVAELEANLAAAKKPSAATGDSEAVSELQFQLAEANAKIKKLENKK